MQLAWLVKPLAAFSTLHRMCRINSKKKTSKLPTPAAGKKRKVSVADMLLNTPKVNEPFLAQRVQLATA